MSMEAFLTIVEDTFDIKGRGLIIAPSFPVSEYKFNTEEKVRIETPNGNVIFCSAYFQVPFQSPRPKIISFCCALLKASKEQVPIGSKIFIVGKHQHEINLQNT